MNKFCLLLLLSQTSSVFAGCFQSKIMPYKESDQKTKSTNRRRASDTRKNDHIFFVMATAGQVCTDEIKQKTSLNLENYNLNDSDKDLERFIGGLLKFSSLEKLNISNCFKKLSERNRCLLFSNFNQLKKLKEIDLSENDLRSKSLATFIDILKNLTEDRICLDLYLGQSDKIDLDNVRQAVCFSAALKQHGFNMVEGSSECLFRLRK